MVEEIKKFILNNINIIQAIIPTIISCVGTLFVARYTYNRSRPLDKLEYAYNEVYYPIYKFINDKNNYNNIYATKNALKVYFDSYEKYLDFSTIKIYNELYNCDTKSKEKYTYDRFIDNINNMNAYLRKRLGYLEPSIFQLFRCLPIQDKISIGIVLMFASACISIILSLYFIKLIEDFIVLFLVFCSGIIILLIIKVFLFIYYKVLDLFF